MAVHDLNFVGASANPVEAAAVVVAALGLDVNVAGQGDSANGCCFHNAG